MSKIFIKFLEVADKNKEGKPKPICVCFNIQCSKRRAALMGLLINTSHERSNISKG